MQGNHFRPISPRCTREEAIELSAYISSLKEGIDTFQIALDKCKSVDLQNGPDIQKSKHLIL